ncbi:hypothetical protein ACFSTC_30790 [Nonomuraea ferruginea]
MEESFQASKDLFGLDESQVRLYEALLRHLVLVMAQPGRLRGRRRSSPAWNRHPRRADPGLIPLTVAEVKRLFNAVTGHPPTLEHTVHWSTWRRRHQARARWFHHRARLATAYSQVN